jgi:glutathione peroxidase
LRASAWLVLLGSLLGCKSSEQPKETAVGEPAKPTSIYGFELRSIDGKGVSLTSFEGKVLLIVNVASHCGFTRQYAGLQKLHEQYGERGLVVLGVPSNDFRQEPGTDEEIAAFCSSQYQVTFPLMSKISVKGSEQHPLYAWLEQRSEGVGWNFNKYLVDRTGTKVHHFESRTTPDAPELVQAIEQALASPPADD